jgi:hypothetical protein
MKKQFLLFSFLFLVVTGFAQVKISEMTTASNIAGTEYVPIVQSSTNKKVTVQKIADFANKLPSPLLLTDASTITWDYDSGANPVSYVTIAGNRTLSVTNVPAGASGIIKVTQDATGNRKLTLPGDTSTVFARTTQASKYDLYAFIKIGSTLSWTSSPFGTGTSGGGGGGETETTLLDFTFENSTGWTLAASSSNASEIAVNESVNKLHLAHLVSGYAVANIPLTYTAGDQIKVYIYSYVQIGGSTRAQVYFNDNASLVEGATNITSDGDSFITINTTGFTSPRIGLRIPTITGDVAIRRIKVVKVE